MAKLFNRAKMTTATTGSGTITLGSAANGFQSFADAGVSDGDVVQYVIEEGSNFEIGTGTYSSSGTSLTRTPSESSESDDSAITLAGLAKVSITVQASQIGGEDRDLSFDDNAKAKFGASDDLQIYHDGSNSYISDQGTGDLLVRGDTNFKVQNASGSHDKIIATGGGSVELYENNVKKFETTSTGISVTGNITVSGTVDGVDIQTLNTTAGAALPKAGGTMTGALRHDQNSASASGGTLTLDLSAANNFYVTISAATTFAFSNKDAGRFGNIIIKQNATGGYSFTLPSECKTPVNGASIVQSTGANEISILAYYVVDSSNILVNYIGDFA